MRALFLLFLEPAQYVKHQTPTNILIQEILVIRMASGHNTCYNEQFDLIF